MLTALVKALCLSWKNVIAVVATVQQWVMTRHFEERKRGGRWKEEQKEEFNTVILRLTTHALPRWFIKGAYMHTLAFLEFTTTEIRNYLYIYLVASSWANTVKLNSKYVLISWIFLEAACVAVELHCIILLNSSWLFARYNPFPNILLNEFLFCCYRALIMNFGNHYSTNTTSICVTSCIWVSSYVLWPITN